jgi:hypothetical protein
MVIGGSRLAGCDEYHRLRYPVSEQEISPCRLNKTVQRPVGDEMDALEVEPEILSSHSICQFDSALLARASAKNVARPKDMRRT